MNGPIDNSETVVTGFGSRRHPDATRFGHKASVRATCQQCGHRFDAEQFNYECENCGSIRLTLHGGAEPLLNSEMEDETMNEKMMIEELQQIDFLTGLPSGHINEIANISKIRDFKANDVLFDEGQKADSLYLLTSGQVLLEVYTETTGCKRILTVGKGELLGWSALTDERRYVARATVTEPSRIIQVDGARMRAICDADPRFGYEFLRRAMSAIAKRLTVTWKQLAELYVAHYVTIPVGAGARND